MQTLKIDPSTLAHHLDVAAQQYDRDKATSLECKEQGLADVFERQAKEAREMADCLRCLESVRYDGEDTITVQFQPD